MSGFPFWLRRLCALILGSLLLGAPLALARDLRRGLAGPSRAKGCEAFGPGYRKIEGTDTCVHVSGSIAAEVTATSRGGGGSFWSVAPKR